MLSFLRFIDKLFPPQVAHAHCDIPCGIYDPHEAQMAAHTVLRITQMIDELKAPAEEPSFDDRKKIISQVSRLTCVKEDHAEIVKHQVRIIWGDYFKQEQLTKYSDLHDLVFRIMKTASKAKQSVDMDAAGELVTMTQEFAEIFWKSKDRKTKRVASGYPTEGEIVVPA